MAERIIISGPPGTRWVNNLGRVQYQFIAALKETCGVCLQYHTKISAGWPIPIHDKCACIQRLIKPGQEAQLLFVDYRELLANMNDEGKCAALGMPNYRLLESGLAAWEDIVTPNRVREFHEVIARKHLPVEQMLAHGVDRQSAEAAYAMVHTPEHERVERERRGLLQKIAGSGIDQEQLVEIISGRLAGRVETGPGLRPKERPKVEKSTAPGPTTDEIRAWKHSSGSDEALLKISKERVVAALGRADAALVTTRIVRDANGRPSASFSCPDHLRQRLRDYILAVQSESEA
jgi:hypothetical protein